MNTKKVLFIGIGFYDYENSITSEFQQLGYEVDYYCETPGETILYKFYRKYMSQQATRFRKRWVREIAANCGTGYELIFIIKCEYLSSEELKIIKRKNPTARFILYLWDSMLRIPGIEQKFHFFNKVFSFDRIDCQQQNMLSFNPLFYRHEYDNDDSLADFKYDLYHIGWYHSDRLELIKQVSNYCEKNNLKAVLKIFTGYGGYLLQRIFGSGLSRSDRRFLIFKPLSASENRQIIVESRAVLDIAHKLQTGLTMRTIELVGMGRKIITTNADIKNYDFYDPNNILIIDRLNPLFDRTFFETPFKKLPSAIKQYYSISNWLKRMIE